MEKNHSSSTIKEEDGYFQLVLSMGIIPKEGEGYFQFSLGV